MAKRVIEVDLTAGGLRELDGEFAACQKLILKRGADKVAKRLAEMGAQKAELYFSHAIYDGKEDHIITVENPAPGHYKVVAKGKTVLFVEFGTGIIGEGHPEPHGLTPGSYSDTIGKGHWKDPDGWYYAHGQKSHGNPYNKPMYTTVKELEEELERVVQEEFGL